MQGNPKQSKKIVSQLNFDFNIESICEFLNIFFFLLISLLIFLFQFFSVCLQDSVLAFHKHGMQGRSLRNGEITQEITDMSRTYKLLGSDK